MANVRSGNSHFVDATGVLVEDAIKVSGILITATSANAVCELTDAAGTTKKLNVRVPTSGDTKHIDLSASPISFANGLKVATLTNAIVTLIYT